MADAGATFQAADWDDWSDDGGGGGDKAQQPPHPQQQPPPRPAPSPPMVAEEVDEARIVHFEQQIKVGGALIDG